ncbi:MAG TPA: hypothetical protein PKL15_03120 [Saprospiraceae bacterium]|nr:hypothetical protein [Saprospiraceae bacterium]
MKNSFNQPQNSAASVQPGTTQDQPGLQNTPFTPDTQMPQYATHAQRSPEAESFRAFIKSRLPREKASQALLNKIRQITKTPA